MLNRDGRHFALGVCDRCGLPARGEKSCEVERQGAAKALQRRRGLLVWWIRRQVPKLMDRCRLRKRSALVVQSSVVPFAVLCGERRCAVELKGNAVKRQTEVRASCLQFCERFAILVVGTATFWSVVSVGKVVSCPSCSTCRSCSPQGSKPLQDMDRWRVMVYRHVSCENRPVPPFAK